jgi:hypothetical protein
MQGVAEESMSDSNLLQTYLAERDVACPGCGYNLRGLASEACPECRQALRLSVSLERPVTRAWFTTIIPLWIVGGGAAVAMLIVFVVAGDEILPDLMDMIRGRGGNDVMWMFIVYPTLVAIALTIAAWRLSRAKGRRWFVSTPYQALVRNWSLVASIGAVVIWTAWLFGEVR